MNNGELDRMLDQVEEPVPKRVTHDIFGMFGVFSGNLFLI
jgi:hypothetical protein